MTILEEVKFFSIISQEIFKQINSIIQDNNLN